MSGVVRLAQGSSSSGSGHILLESHKAEIFHTITQDMSRVASHPPTPCRRPRTGLHAVMPNDAAEEADVREVMGQKAAAGAIIAAAAMNATVFESVDRLLAAAEDTIENW